MCTWTLQKQSASPFSRLGLVSLCWHVEDCVPRSLQIPQCWLTRLLLISSWVPHGFFCGLAVQCCTIILCQASWVTTTPTLVGRCHNVSNGYLVCVSVLHVCRFVLRLCQVQALAGAVNIIEIAGGLPNWSTPYPPTHVDICPHWNVTYTQFTRKCLMLGVNFRTSYSEEWTC